MPIGVSKTNSMYETKIVHSPINIADVITSEDVVSTLTYLVNLDFSSQQSLTFINGRTITDDSEVEWTYESSIGPAAQIVTDAYEVIDSSVLGDNKLISDGLTNENGNALVLEIPEDNTGNLLVGLSSDTASTDNLKAANDGVSLYDSYVYDLSDLALGTSGKFVAVSLGNRVLWFDVSTSSVELLHVSNQSISTTVYPEITGTIGSRLSRIAVANLVTNNYLQFTEDFGIATEALEGSQATATPFTHEANTIIEFTITTMPTYNNVGHYFRQESASPRSAMYLMARSDGTVRLYEVTEGSYSLVANSVVSVLSPGCVVTVRALFENISVLVDGVEVCSYNSATAFQNNTDGEVLNNGDGIGSDYIIWPIYQTASSNEALLALVN